MSWLELYVLGDLKKDFRTFLRHGQEISALFFKVLFKSKHVSQKPIMSCKHVSLILTETKFVIDPEELTIPETKRRSIILFVPLG